MSHVPQAHASLFSNLGQTERAAALVSVSTFVERRESLGKSKGKGGPDAEGDEARKILAKRGLIYQRLCLLSSGRHATVLDAFGFQPDPARPGLYRTAPGWRVDLVVIADLPRTRETLLLRLLGARAVLRDAIRELTALPDDAWERSIALPCLVRVSFELPPEASARAALDPEEEEIVTEAQQWFEQLKQSLPDEARKEALQEGIKEGQLGTRASQFERKLGRPLAEVERSVLAQRFDRLGPDRLDEVLVELPADAMAAWLADPPAR